MGFFKKLFNDVGDAIKNNVEERKQEIRQNIEDRKQQFYESIEERKKEVLSKLGVISEETDQQSASIYDVVTTSDDNNRKIDGSIVEETAKNKQEQEHEESMKEDNYPEVRNECKSEILSNPSAEEGGIFSARLESMIAAALQDGVLTDKERELLKRRVEKEGEDWEEVEMIIESRLAEMKSARPSVHATSANATAEKDYTEEAGAEKMRSLSQADEKDIPSTQETVVEASKETDGTGLIVYENGETDVLNADCNKIDDEQFDYCDSDIVKVILPSGIKRIGKRAFYHCKLLEEVDFSKCSKLEIIEELAFSDCYNLKVVDLSGCAKLKVIDDSAFDYCEKLESLFISQCKKLERIGNHAFGLFDDGSNFLKKVIFPVSIKSIDDYAFCERSNLEEIDFSQCLQLESIGDKVFNCSKLKQVVFPASLKKIWGAFYMCEELEFLDFSSCTQLEYVGANLVKSSNSIKVIDFSNCEKLNLSPLNIYKDFEKIILPPGQTSFNAICIWDQFGYNIDKSLCHFQHIKKEAFSEMEITEIEIPDTVEEIELNAFKGCEQLKTIVLPASLKKMDSLGWGLERLKKLDFSKVTQLKKIPENVVSECPKLRELTIPNGVVEIEDDAFSEASNLRTLFLPPTLEEIGELGLKKLDIYCFSPAIEELTPLVVAIFDNEEEDEEEDDEEKKKIDPKSYRINLFVLPQYLEKYIAQRNAERISKDVLVIQAIPDEYLYYYDK